MAGNTTVSGNSHRIELQSRRARAVNSLNVTGNSTFGGARALTSTWPVTSPAIRRHRRRRRGAVGHRRDHLWNCNSLTVSSVVGTFRGGDVHPRERRGSLWRCVSSKRLQIFPGVRSRSNGNAGTTASGAAVQEDDTLPIQAAMAAFCAQSTRGIWRRVDLFAAGNLLSFRSTCKL